MLLTLWTTLWPCTYLMQVLSAPVRGSQKSVEYQYHSKRIRDRWRVIVRKHVSEQRWKSARCIAVSFFQLFNRFSDWGRRGYPGLCYTWYARSDLTHAMGKRLQVERRLDGGLFEKTAVAVKPKPHALACGWYHLLTLKSHLSDSPRAPIPMCWCGRIAHICYGWNLLSNEELVIFTDR